MAKEAESEKNEEKNEDPKNSDPPEKTAEIQISPHVKTDVYLNPAKLNLDPNKGWEQNTHFWARQNGTEGFTMFNDDGKFMVLNGDGKLSLENDEPEEEWLFPIKRSGSNGSVSYVKFGKKLCLLYDKKEGLKGRDCKELKPTKEEDGFDVDIVTAPEERSSCQLRNRDADKVKEKKKDGEVEGEEEDMKQEYVDARFADKDSSEPEGGRDKGSKNKKDTRADAEEGAKKRNRTKSEDDDNKDKKRKRSGDDDSPSGKSKKNSEDEDANDKTEKNNKKTEDLLSEMTKLMKEFKEKLPEETSHQKGRLKQKKNEMKEAASSSLKKKSEEIKNKLSSFLGGALDKLTEGADAAFNPTKKLKAATAAADAIKKIADDDKDDS